MRIIATSQLASTKALENEWRQRLARSPFIWEASAAGFYIRIPHWSLVLSFGSIGLLSWFPKRFGLRTLLIATTLIAVILGVIVYAAK
jgi:hypothetical protein